MHGELLGQYLRLAAPVLVIAEQAVQDDQVWPVSLSFGVQLEWLAGRVHHFGQ